MDSTREALRAESPEDVSLYCAVCGEVHPFTGWCRGIAMSKVAKMNLAMANGAEVPESSRAQMPWHGPRGPLTFVPDLEPQVTLRDQLAMTAPFAPFQTYAADAAIRCKELREAASLRYEWADAMLKARKQ